MRVMEDSLSCTDVFLCLCFKKDLPVAFGKPSPLAGGYHGTSALGQAGPTDLSSEHSNPRGPSDEN